MKRKTILCIMTVFCLLLWCACSAQTESTTAQIITESTKAADMTENTAVSDETEDEGFSFTDIEGLEFYHSSGAGAWRTVMYIHGDGSFEGDYSDSDMGDSDVLYPDGTVYRNVFSGKYSRPKKVDDMTFEFEIESLEYKYEMGEEIEDSTRYVYTEAAGLDGVKFYIYLPGSKLSDLPEGFLMWAGYYNIESTEGKVLENYGLYNADSESGFVGYEPITPRE